MNQKNSLGLEICFKEFENPIDLFREWFNEAKKSEINDPNALSLATADKNGLPSVRVVLLKDFSQTGFIFYTNLNSKKSSDLKINPEASMCFHWKSLLRQVRINGKIKKVSDKEADEYFSKRPYGNKIGAWASNQSQILENLYELFQSIKKYEKKYIQEKNVPRPNHWSGWKLEPKEIEFWKDGENRIHQRLKYIKKNNFWDKVILSP